MPRWFKRSLVGVAALALVAAGTIGAGAAIGQAKRHRIVAVSAHPIDLRADAGRIERGRYLFTSRGCSECHGANGAGRVVIDDTAHGMRVVSPNISPGAGSVVQAYRAEDWERTVRHGVDPHGRPLLVMPAEDYNRLTDDDVAAVAAYVRQLPPAAGGPASLTLPPLFPVLYGFGVIKDAAEKIDHTLPPATPVPEGVTVDHGRTIGQMCQGCHGPHLSGGKVPGAPPDWPAAANLTPGAGSAMRRYPDAAAFKAMLRSGRRPDRTAVSKVMPFESLAALTDQDAEALYLFLRSLPPRDAGGR